MLVVFGRTSGVMWRPVGQQAAEAGHRVTTTCPRQSGEIRVLL